MATGQIELGTIRFYDPATNESGVKECLQISDKTLLSGDSCEVLLPVGWKQTQIYQDFDGNYRFTSLPIKPVGVIARTID